MGRFIQVALRRPILRSAWLTLKVTPDIEEMTGVYVASGIGGFDIIEREHSKLLQGGPGRISPFFHSRLDREFGLRAYLHSVRAQRSEFSDGAACSASAHALGDSFRRFSMNMRK